MSEREASTNQAVHKLHQYRATCTWSGDTGQGYEHYGRSHQAQAAPTQAALSLSADPAFRGDPKLLNPEQLLVIAAASCQLLSFLARAARAGVSILSYIDCAEAVMPEDKTPIRITSIHLNPRIEAKSGPTEARVLELLREAHEECYIANSLRSEIVVQATIVFV